eukprot:6125916-Amphidinium_carterae.1
MARKISGKMICPCGLECSLARVRYVIGSHAQVMVQGHVSPWSGRGARRHIGKGQAWCHYVSRGLLTTWSHALILSALHPMLKQVAYNVRFPKDSASPTCAVQQCTIEVQCPKLKQHICSATWLNKNLSNTGVPLA